jgi:hypothetical protein
MEVKPTEGTIYASSQFANSAEAAARERDNM